MSEEILVNASAQETRVALVENGLLQEIHVERHHARGMVGNIYQGKVVRILPGIQSAFVDIGLGQTAFLHQADLAIAKSFQDNHQHADAIVEKSQSNSEAPHSYVERELPNIQDHLREGQKIIVQVIKDPLGTKGARLSTAITIPARHLVYMPYSEHIGISQKIKDVAERERLRLLIENVVHENFASISGGFIVRTVAEFITKSEAEQDIRYLQKLWGRITQRIEKGELVNGRSGVGLIHEDMPLLLRFMRDVVHEDIERIRIDNAEAFVTVKDFAHDVVPEVEPRIEQYQGKDQIFELYGIDNEINNALNRTVPLKSGGYLVIDRTEAMTTIDVNTGSYVGRRNMEETLFKTNLEAAQTIARQLRLRNLSGIIIVDFIDMKDEDHKLQVLKALEAALSRDRVKNNITEMSSLGLVEITRKRIRESLDETLSEKCPVCHGKGTIKTAETICYEIFREILRQENVFDASKYLIIAAPKVIDTLMDQESQSLQNIQDKVGRPINLQVDNLYPTEVYDVIML